MECHLFKMLVQKYHDGELDLAGMAEYENHFMECGECRRLDAQFAGVFSALDGIKLLEPSPGFDMNVMAHVDVARFRVSIARKAWISLRGLWQGLPKPLRVTGIAAPVFALFVAVYSPILLTMVLIAKKGVGVAGYGLYMIRKVVEDPSIIIHYLNLFEKYRVAGKILIKTAHRQAGGIPVTYSGLGIVIAVVMLVVIIRMTRIAWSKGETHVGIS